MAKNPSKASLDYRSAGVDVDAGNQLVDRIKPLARATARAGADGALGGFGGLFDPKAAGFTDPVMVATTDGVGTKLKLAIAAGLHDTIGIDLVAMCVNDLIVQGAKPLIFLDYFACGKLDLDVASAVIKGIADGCHQAECALIGGETAEMPGVYADGVYDLAGFAVGAAERSQLIDGSKITAGDVLIGLASSGVHSNGYSLVRKIVETSGVDWLQPAPFAAGERLIDLLLTPTRIYVTSVLAAIAKGGVHGLCHITGGGFYENLPRLLADDSLIFNLDRSSWPESGLFQWLADEGGIAAHEMHRTFNCGIGMVLVVAADQADAVIQSLQQSGETAYRIGQMVVRDDTKAASVHIAGIDD